MDVNHGDHKKFDGNNLFYEDSVTMQDPRRNGRLQFQTWQILYKLRISPISSLWFQTNDYLPNKQGQQKYFRLLRSTSIDIVDKPIEP